MPETVYYFVDAVEANRPFFSNPSFWAIVGVFLGFCLSEFSSFFRRWLSKKRMKKIIREELIAVKHQSLQKKEHLKEIIKAIKEKHILPGLCLGTINIAYKKYFSEIYECLSLLERNCLYMIHTDLEMNDRLLEEYEESIIRDVKENRINDPYTKHSNDLQDLLKSYEQDDRWIDSYLDGNPEDVLHIKKLTENPEKKWRWIYR